MTNKLPKFEGMTDEDEAVLRGAIVRMNASESSGNNVTEYAVSKHSLETLANRIADLEAQLAEARRHNELLRAVAEAADFMAWCYVDQAEESEQMQLRQVLQAAIDGGAMEVE